MVPSAVVIVLVVAAMALGSLLATFAIGLPGLAQAAANIDANLGTALGRPIALRAADLDLLAAIVLATLAWIPGAARGSGSLALGLVVVAGVRRVDLVPDLFDAWSRVDRVAAGPLAALHRAERSADLLAISVAISALLYLGVLALGMRARRMASTPASAAPIASPTASQVVTKPVRSPS